MCAGGGAALGLTACSQACYDDWENPRFTNEETETGRDEVIGPSSHSW